MASGWNQWVWLQCIVWLVGVVIRRYIDILIIIINSLYVPEKIAYTYCSVVYLTCSSKLRLKLHTLNRM